MMLEIIEDYCKVCGDTYDPLFGCRCAVIRGFGSLIDEEVTSSDSAVCAIESVECSKIMQKNKNLRIL